MKPHAHLARLVSAIDGQYPVPPDVGAWLLGGLREFIDSSRPLCVCLGLRGAGITSISTAIARARRNAALLAAYEAAGFVGDSETKRCEAVALAVSKFHRVAPRRPAAPCGAFVSMFDAIADAVSTGVDLPQTTSGIRKIVAAARSQTDLAGELEKLADLRSRNPPAIHGKDQD